MSILDLKLADRKLVCVNSTGLGLVKNSHYGQRRRKRRFLLLLNPYHESMIILDWTKHSTDSKTREISKKISDHESTGQQVCIHGPNWARTGTE